MKKKRFQRFCLSVRDSLFIVLLASGLNITSALAQENQQVEGVVKDENGDPLIGASVIVEGTNKGSITDINGQFTVNAPVKGTLVISYIGYDAIQTSVKDKKKYVITLKQNSKKLNDLVVTALGIKREEKGLGFATQTIGNSSLTDSRTNNWATALAGKVPGLNIISPGAGPLASSRISLRGDNSMNVDGNNALIVLDGVPLSNSSTGTGASAYAAGSGGDVPIDFGNGINDINPEDIESVTVLKGASAAALYGSRAANGALIITTKSGAKQKGLGISFSSNFSIDNVLKWPDWQYEYGQGTQTKDTNGNWYYSYGASADGVSTGGTSSAFGPKFEGQMYYQYDPTLQGQSAERQLWRPYKDNIKGFWRTGTTLSNSVSVEGASDKSNFRFSVTHLKNDWIMPNTGFERLALATSYQHKITDKLRLSVKSTFTNRKTDNLPATGYNNQSISYFMIFQNPNIDLNWYRPIWKKGQEQLAQIHPFSTYIDNPYLIAYEMENPSNKNMFVGTSSLTYELSRKLEFMIRTGAEMSYEDREQHRPYNTANYAQGYFKKENINNFEVNSDFLITYREQFSRKLGIRASAGGNTLTSQYRYMSGSITGLVNPGVYKLSNGLTSPFLTSNDKDKQVNSLYGTASFNYGKAIFVDVTGRNDWSSTLPVENNSFFYPSVSSSIVLSDLIKLPAIISFAKLRGSFAQVGNDTEPYKTAKYYTPSAFSGSAEMATTLYNKSFKPEISSNYEVGLDYRMFNNRLGMDVTLYRNFTKNQILEVPLDPTTGYTRATMNAGKVRNQGIELQLTATPVKINKFQWNSTLSWSANRNKILELSPGMESEGQQLLAQVGTVYYYGKVGGSLGDMYGNKLLRSPDGQVIFNKADGLTAKSQNLEYVGNAYAKWKAGLHNEFLIGNVRINFSFDGQWGGLVYSQSHHKMTEQGKLMHTLVGRDSPDGKIVGIGVVDNGDGTYSPNTTRVLVKDYYADYYRRANVESNSFDASYLKMRSARIEYKFPKKLANKLSLAQLSLALYGENLFMLTKNFPLFDPEAAALNSSSIVPGVEMGQLPSTRTLGINLNLKL